MAEPDWTPYAGAWVTLNAGQVVAVGVAADEAEHLARRAWPEAALETRRAPDVQVRTAWGEIPLFARLQPLLAGQPVWLVGGAVRDLLLGRPLHDLDFVVDGDGLKLARRVADRLGGAFYALDSVRRTGRIVLTLPDGAPFVIDCAALRTPEHGLAGLHADLADRDFTLNALALPLDDPTPSGVIDLFDGRADLAARRIRVVGPQSIARDPNRVLRALRLARVLAFEIEPATLAHLRAGVPALAQVAAERTRDEFIKLLGAPGVAQAVRMLDDLGALAVLAPDVTALHGVEQAPPHYEDAFEHTLTVLDRLEHVLSALGLGPARADALGQGAALDWVAARLGRFRAPLAAHLAQVLSDVRTRRDLLMCGALWHDCGKPRTQMRGEDGRIRFPEHDTQGAEIVRARAHALRLSSPEVQGVGQIVRHHMLWNWQKGFDAVAAYRFFRSAGPAGIETCLLTLADQLAAHARYAEAHTRWPLKVAAVEALLSAYYEHHAEVIAPPVLVSGHTLITTFNLAPGPRVGELLEQIREAQVAGQVRDAEQALALVRAQVS